MDKCIVNSVYYLSIIVTLSLTWRLCVCSLDIKVEAEGMLGGAGSIVTARARASGRKAVHMYRGQRLQHEMCMTSTTRLSLSTLMYSNDGEEDRIQIALDDTVLGIVETVIRTDNGRAWNDFIATRTVFPDIVIAEGRHLLSITVLDSDKHGVEVDYVALALNTTQTQDSLSCHVFCFKNVQYQEASDVKGVTPGRAEQRSTLTKCAEEDNVNIPVYHDSAEKFVISANLPQYTSFLNNRGPDWSNCQMAEAFWQFSNINVRENNATYHSRMAHMKLAFQHGFILNSNYLGSVEITFTLNGPSTGHTDSEIGTIVVLKEAQFSGTVAFQFEYFDRSNQWTGLQVKTVKNSAEEITFDTPDFSFREGAGNRIKIAMYSEQNDINSLSIGDIYMIKRYMQPDANQVVYEDSTTVIEAVDIDMWWRINETMTLTVADAASGRTYHDVDYIRVYQRVPWQDNGFSQVFVLYQDGNVRLLPITPHGLDWIPFGSSVIIGQTDPTSVRPAAPILHVNIDPVSLKLTIYYMDGGVVPLQVVSSFKETKLEVSESTYTRDLATFPFFTFRSMFVSDGNSDVDHVTADNAPSINIIEPWGSLYGHYFAFFRKCISKHNTLSPDITLNIIK